MILFLIAFSAVLFFLFDQHLAAAIILCGAFWLSGWYFAHSTVATECDRFGKFYVGKNVYQCSKIESKD
nr:hypothetical protein [uncultured Haemophilus sp.]